MIDLYVEPKTAPLSWMAFRRTAPPNSIAIDGYVKGGPVFERSGPHLNLNHHEGVSRMETRATCAQALLAVRMGLFETFRDEKGNPFARVYANDCDEDVCLTVYVLQNPFLTEHTAGPTLNRLVFMEDMLDTTAGAYALSPDLRSYREMNWVFEPYRRFRVSGGLDRRDEGEFLCVIEDVTRRIGTHIAGTGNALDFDTRYELVGSYSGWKMVREIGMNARLGLYRDGVDAFVSVRERPDGRWAYSIGRKSAFIPFDVPRILDRLNESDYTVRDDMWGGSDLIAGSPRVRGSGLDPKGLAEVVESVVRPALV